MGKKFAEYSKLDLSEVNGKVLTGKSKASGFSCRERGTVETAQKTKSEEHP